ncbi:MAG: BON domain-containing protein [Actinomycetota bacterium]|nr:BON domain-containing protein [Actinomycetota bacterium]
MTQTLHRTDHQLKTSIARALEWAPDVNSDHVAVSVTQGAVVLSGEVLAYPEKAAATKAALSVHGITALADEITVKHTWGDRADADIARDTAAALSTSAVIPADAVRATITDQWVTLSGEVHWNFQREAAVNLAGDITGVVGVHNNIQLKPVVPFAAVEARSAVKAALVRGALDEAHDITVGGHGTELELTGTVHSWHEFREAADAAWATPGVTHVHNRLVVVS